MHLFLLWLTVTLQGPGGPELPVVLAQDAAVVEAWGRAQSAEDAAARRTAAATVFAELGRVREAGQLDFLLACEDAGTPEQAVVTPELRRLQEEWAGFAAAIAQRIADDTAAEPVRRGAVQVAARLTLADTQVVSALGARLDDLQQAPAARAALRGISGREFSDVGEFDAWWEDAQGLSREAWLAAAQSEMRAILIADWDSRIAADPDAAVQAVRHPVPEVRGLGYEAMRRLPVPEGRPSDSPEAKAIIERMQSESVHQYRRLLIRMVTRFLQGQDAVSQLSVAIDRGRGEERELAVRELQLVEPAAVALEAFRAQLALAYPQETTQATGSQGYRIALWAGLASLVREARPGEEALAAFQTDLLASLSIEPVPEVKKWFYEAAGEVGSAGFIASLENYLRVKERAVQERVQALRAMTRIADRTQVLDPLRESLPVWLADADRTIRRQAIKSLGQLPLEAGPQLLLARLPLEGDSGLLPNLLEALKQRAAPETLRPLLDYRPPSALVNTYAQTLAAVVGADWGRLTVALEGFEAQHRYGQARDLIKLFPVETLTEAQVDTLAMREARVLARHLLRVGLDGQAPATVADAVSRLVDQQGLHPEAPEWPLLYVQLQLVRGETGDALVWMERFVLPNEGVTPNQRWEVGLQCLRGARAKDLMDAGRALLAALGEPPPEFRYIAEQEARHFEQAPAPESGEDEGALVEEAGADPESGLGGELPNGGAEAPAGGGDTTSGR